MGSATQQFCTFFLDEHLFGVEVEMVQEVIRQQHMTPVPLAPPVVGGLINLRGQLVTAIDLRRQLDLPPRADGKPPMNVVLKTDDGHLSLLVDRISDILEVSQDAFERSPETVQGVARELIRGAYKLDEHLMLALRTDKAIDIASAHLESRS